MSKPNTPWRATKVGGVIHIVNEHGGSIATTEYEDKAEFIVRACNSYEALLTALREVAALVDYMDRESLASAINGARIAIAKAEQS